MPQRQVESAPASATSLVDCRGWRWGLGVGIALALLGFLYFWARPPVLPLADAPLYVSSAQALAAGQGYRLPGYPTAPPNTYFPPVYPVLLAAIFALQPDFPANLPLLQLASLLTFYALLAVSAVALRRFYQASPRDVALALLLASTTPVALKLSTAVMSDSLYGVLALGALLLVEASRDRPGARGLGLLLGGATLAVLAYYTRTAGIALLAALAIEGLRRASRLAPARLALLLCPLLAATPWFVVTSLHGGSAYLRQLLRGTPGYHVGLDSPAHLAHVVLGHLALGLDILWVVAPLLVDLSPLGTALLLYVAYRSARAWWRGGPVVHLYVLLYLVLLLLWPWRVPGRFLWPMAPLLAWHALVGVRAGAAWVERAGRRPAAAALRDRASPLRATAVGALRALWRRRREWRSTSDRAHPGPVALEARQDAPATLVATVIVGSVLAFNAAAAGVAIRLLATEGWVGEPVPQATYQTMLATAAYLRAVAPADAVLGTNHWHTASWWYLYTGRRTIDALARADGLEPFYVRRALAGAPAAVTYFVYQRDNGRPANSDDLPTVRALLAQRGASTTPLFCAGDGAVCVFDWRPTTATPPPTPGDRPRLAGPAHAR